MDMGYSDIIEKEDASSRQDQLSTVQEKTSGSKMQHSEGKLIKGSVESGYLVHWTPSDQFTQITYYLSKNQYFS